MCAVEKEKKREVLMKTSLYIFLSFDSEIKNTAVEGIILIVAS